MIKLGNNEVEYDRLDEFFPSYCEYCKKETIHSDTQLSRDCRVTGLLGAYRVECSECGTRTIV